MRASLIPAIGTLCAAVVLIHAAGLCAGPQPEKMGAGSAPPAPNKPSVVSQDPVLDELRLLSETISSAINQGEFSKGVQSAKAFSEQLEKWGRAKPWEIVDARRRVDLLVRIADWPAADQKEWLAIRGKERLAFELNSKGKYVEAQELFDEVVKYYAEREATPGGSDPSGWAQSLSNAGLNLYLQAQFVKAQPCFEKAMTLRQQVLGADHPETAASYQNCGENLRAQGQYQRAQGLFEKALVTQEKLRGPADPVTATAANSLALCLAGQGKFAAARPLYENALVILRQSRGINHRDTAAAYSNLASNLIAQGRYADAQPLFEKALAIFLQQKDPESRDAATAYNNLGTILRIQGRHAEGQPHFEKALELRVKTIGPRHADTGQSHYNLAVNLGDQERYEEAQPHFETALAIFREQLTDHHADTAIGHLKLAGNLQHLGRFPEAQTHLERSLAIRREVFGENHPDTAQGYHELALNSHYQADDKQALELWTKAADSFEQMRLLIALSGLDRAVKTGEQSPLLFLAALHARRGERLAAWNRWESSMARGLLDDLAARPAGKLSPEDRQREQELRAELRRLDVVRAVLQGQSLDRQEREIQSEVLHTEQLALQAKMSEFEQDLAKKYGVAQGQSYDLKRIQDALEPDTAMVSWLDIPGNQQARDPQGEHWGLVIRKLGEPVWVKLPGTGELAAWTPDDDQLGQQLAGVLANTANRPLRHTAGQIRQLITELKDQRIAPLEPHLVKKNGLPLVTRLIVLPAAAMRAVPIELLVNDQLTVSYAPSATLFAWLKEQRALRGAPQSAQTGLLAVGDPIFEQHPIPEGGVLINTVNEGGAAQRGGLRSGDVLLAYAGRRLNTAEDLRAGVAAAASVKKPVPVVVWRRGETLQIEVPAGKLSAGLLPEGAPEILRKVRSSEQVSRSTRESFQQLPGTRTEVEAISRTFAAARLTARVFLGGQANEEHLAELAAKDELKNFRFLHFATHGVPDVDRPMRSRIILSRNNLPDPRQQLLAGKPIYRGELTAEQVLNEWKLDADLVSLSACQSGLGQYATGEGYLGFAQALLLSGARSLLLSLWKVDDAATSLLMTRFYENILGTRPGLQGPLPKAVALHEAKIWLRRLTADQVTRLTSSQDSGGTAAVAKTDAAAAHANDRPFEHPAYWAAFILIGTPD